MVFDELVRILVSPRNGKVAGSVPFLRMLRLFLMSLVSGAAGLAAASSFAEPQYELGSSPQTGQIRQVQVALEVSGQLKLNADGKRVTRLPLRVKGNMLYEEKLLEFDPQLHGRRDVRYYRQAEATIQVGEGEHENRLSDDRRILVTEISDTVATIFSPLGPLTRDELELIDIQGSSSVLYRLLPGKKVSIGESWPIDDTSLAMLLGLEAITRSDVQSTLRQVEDDVAIIDMSGSVSGAVGGVSSDIEIKAKYNFNLSARDVTWLAMAIQENRSIGHAEPGFEVTARLRSVISSHDELMELSDVALAELPLKQQPGSTLLSFSASQGGFRFLHGRSWRTMIDRHDVTILRLIERGDLIAQCNASRLPDLPAGQHVQLEAFQADIVRALGKNFGQFVEASQTTSDNGLRVLRAVISGVADELPIQWTYYHISDGRGRQASLVFTMEAKLFERFAQSDHTFISSFEFVDSPKTETEVDAPPTRTVRPDTQAAAELSGTRNESKTR